MSEETNTEHETPKVKRTKRPPLEKLLKKQWLGIVVGVVAGILVLASVHFVRDFYEPVHYHANFALYVNGVREEFKSPTNYEEIQACGENHNDPKGRVHLHDQDAGTVHVHDYAVTWGELLANVNYAIGDNVLKTSQGVYVDGVDGKQLAYILNGEQVFDVANRVIGDKDVLLISYGNESFGEQKKHFDAIPRTAEEHDRTADPAACSGSEAKSIPERIQSALGLSKTNVMEH